MQRRNYKEKYRAKLQQSIRHDSEYCEFFGRHESDVIQALYETRTDVRLYLDQQQVVETLDRPDFIEATKGFLRRGGRVEIIVDDTTLVPSDYVVPIMHTKERWWNEGIQKNVHFILAYGFTAFKVEGESKRFGEFEGTDSISTLAYILEWDKLMDKVPLLDQVAKNTAKKP